MSYLAPPDKAAELVRQLCRAVSPRKPHWVVVVLFEMYMDETGTHEQAPVTGAAAYLARSDQWENFTLHWTTALQKFGIEVFHATDYENSKGEFLGWKPPKKLALAKCLFPLLPSNTWIGIGNAIVNQDWESALVGHKELKAQLGSPYLGCFQRIIDRLLMNFKSHSPEDQIAVLVECNDFTEGINKIWVDWLKRQDTQNRLVSLSFGGKKDFVPLQAADALAYESYKALDNQRFQRDRKRKSLEIMQSTGNIEVFTLDKRSLPRAVARAERLYSQFKHLLPVIKPVRRHRTVFAPKQIELPRLPNLLNPQLSPGYEQRIALPSGREVRVPKVTPVFHGWHGPLPADRYGNKQVLEYNREMLFAELLILRIFEQAGWDGRWIDTFRNKYRTGYWTNGESKELPAAEQVILDAIRAKAGHGGGCFDVFCWRDKERVFVESKWKGNDVINKNQKRWLESALTLGIPLECFLIVEWTLA